MKAFWTVWQMNYTKIFLLEIFVKKGKADEISSAFTYVLKHVILVK